MTKQDGFIDEHGTHAANEHGAADGEPRAVLQSEIVGVSDGHAQVAPYTISAQEPTIIAYKETVRLLRSTLKNRHPDVRFKVRVTHGMEQSIDIEWTGGPLADEVVVIARDYIGAGYRRGSLVSNDGKDVDQPGRGMGVGGSRYDVSRIVVCRLKADGSVDTNRVVHANGIE